MIKVKEGKCSDCQKETKLIAKRCQTCYWKHRKAVKMSDQKSDQIKEVEEKKVSRIKKNNIIPKQSAKRRSQNVLYLKKRRIFMEQNNTCQAQLQGCTNYATDLHHQKGRCGELLTDESNFMALCRSCHKVIEENPLFAKEHGFSKNRL